MNPLMPFPRLALTLHASLCLYLCPVHCPAEVIVQVFDRPASSLPQPVKKPSFLKRLFTQKDSSKDPSRTNASHGHTHGQDTRPSLRAKPCTEVKLDFISSTERQKRAARGYARLKTVDGVYGVEGHGTPTHMYCKTGQKLSAPDLAQWIKNDRRYKRGMTVHLLACETGKGPRPFAQEVSDLLHAPVVAPTEKLWVHQDGNYSVTGASYVRVLGLIPIANGQADPDRPGEMKTFRPVRSDLRT